MVHGHDHAFAKEVLDGVVYQLVPQPGLDRQGLQRDLAALYPRAELAGGPGYLRVSVGSDSTRVEMIQVDGEGGDRVARSYSVRPRCIGGCQ